MRKVIFWIFLTVMGIPLAVIAWQAATIFAIYPLLHAWNVQRMDARNDQVWDDAPARVVTVEAELGTGEGQRTLATEIVCYEGNFARDWNLKDSAPATGKAARSVGFEVLLAEFQTGATLDIDLGSLCNQAFRMEIDAVPQKVRHRVMSIVAPELGLYCSFHNLERSQKHALHTDAGWVGQPYFVAIEQKPLRGVIPRAELASSESGYEAEFHQRWDPEFEMNRSHWREDRSCWTDKVGQCDAALTDYCGRNPR